MRKILIVFVLSAFTLAFVACGDNPTSQFEEQQQTAAQPTDVAPQSTPTAQAPHVEEQPTDPENPSPNTALEATPTEHTPLDEPYETLSIISPDVIAEEQPTTPINEVPTNENISAENLPLAENPVSTATRTEPVSQEEAEQLGVRYVLDVFGTDIGGMYLLMEHRDSPCGEHTIWHCMILESESAARARNIAWMYMFEIDSITGERLSITRSNTQAELTAEEQSLVWADRSVGLWDELQSMNLSDEEFEAMWLERTSELTRINNEWWDAWNNMSLPEQIATSNLTPEAIERYRNTATGFARRHFNNSSVADVQLYSIVGMEGRRESNGGYIVPVSLLDFTATDDTGRKIRITITSDTSLTWIDMVSIFTL